MRDWIDKPYYLGDIVEIVEPGNCYDRYDSWAQYHNIPDWDIGNFCERGMQGTVICTAPHSVTTFREIYKGPKYKYNIIAIRLNKDRCVLVGNEGIKLVSRQMIEDELFEI